MTDRVELTIGKIHDGPLGRDAVHIAVVQVVAGQRLYPAQAVGFAEGGTERVCAGVAPVGIIDPFLPGYVSIGERCWMFLLPGSITSLRHEWTHPAFATETDKETSEAWLRDFIEHADCPRYETVVETAIGQGARQWSSDFLHFNTDAHGDIPPEFWDHIEVVTGRKIPLDERPTAFSCGCG